MSKVDMSRYVECPVCHTYQITLKPCQKCLARKMAAEGRLPASGIVPMDPFKIYSQEQKELKNGIVKEGPRKIKIGPDKPKETPEEMRERMRITAQKGWITRKEKALAVRTPKLVNALKDGESHYIAELTRDHIIPFGVSVTSWVVTRTMLQMGLLEWSKVGPHHNSPVRIWIPALKIQDAIEYAEALKNGKN